MNEKLTVLRSNGNLIFTLEAPQSAASTSPPAAAAPNNPAPVWRIEIKQTSEPTKRSDHLRSALFIQATLGFFIEYVISMLRLDQTEVGLSIEVSTPAAGTMSAEGELAKKKIRAEIAHLLARETQLSSHSPHRN